MSEPRTRRYDRALLLGRSGSSYSSCARSSDTAATASATPTTSASTVCGLDPFVGSGNTLFWLARRLEPRVAVGFELDDAVAEVTQRNVALLDLPIDVRPEPYERGIQEIRVDEDELVVVFVAPPWGLALGEDGELDLRRHHAAGGRGRRSRRGHV